MIAELNPSEAWEALRYDPDAVLVDVRSRVEFDYVGHPPRAINVPWQEPPCGEVVPDFAATVRQALSEARPEINNVEDLKVFTLCRSGARSAAAGNELARNGFRQVINIAEGFEGKLDEDKHRGNINGWRYRRLPWEQT